jgi:hypothetical protein
MCLRQTCWSMGGRVGASPHGARAELERRNKNVFSYSQFSHACGDESLAPRVVRMCRRPQPREGSHKLLLLTPLCPRGEPGDALRGQKPKPSTYLVPTLEGQAREPLWAETW